MDRLYGHEVAQEEDEFDPSHNAAIDAPLSVTSQDRRMQVRAYSYWASLLGERDLPSIRDLSAEHFQEFGPYCLLLDFSDAARPAIAYLGSALQQECPGAATGVQIVDVPSNSLLARLTAPYRQVLSQGAPAAFESEFVNARHAPIMYRGLLMPLSSDGMKIDFMLGVINWKERASSEQSNAIECEMLAAMRKAAEPVKTAPLWSSGPDHMDRHRASIGTSRTTMSLADRLALARTSAAQARVRQKGSDQLLYRAIGHAHDIALAAKAAPQEFTALIAEEGRMHSAATLSATVAHLVFGGHFGWTRVREFALILDHAMKSGAQIGELAERLVAYPGGLRAMIREARLLRASPDAKARIVRFDDTIDPASISTDAHGQMVLVAQRDADGVIVLRHALSPKSAAARRAIAATPPLIDDTDIWG